MTNEPIDRRVCKPENACLLVKMEGDPKTYHVVLPMESRLMLVQLASSLSPKGVLEVMPFDGVEFKPIIAEPPVPPQLIIAKALWLAEAFALSKEWKRSEWRFVKFRDEASLKGQIGLNKTRTLWVVTNQAKALDMNWAESEGRGRGFKIERVEV